MATVVKRLAGREIASKLLNIAGYSDDDIKALRGNIRSVTVVAPVDDVVQVTVELLGKSEKMGKDYD